MSTEALVKSVRVEIDTIFNSFVFLPKKSREISLAFTALQLSKMWLGKVLAGLGAANPYPNSKNALSPKIEPTADTGPGNVFASNAWLSIVGSGACPDEDAEHVAKVKYLRACISNIIDAERPAVEHGSLVTLAATQGYVNLTEASLWLGMELARMKEMQDTKAQS